MAHKLHDQPLIEDYFRRDFTLKSSGAAIQNIYGVTVKPTLVHVYTLLSIEDLTGGYTKLRIGVDAAGSFNNYFEHDDPQGGLLYWTPREIRVFEHERLQIQLVGVDANDIVKIYLQAFKIEEVNARNRRSSDTGSGDSSETKPDDHGFGTD